MLRTEKQFLDTDEENQSAELDGHFDQNFVCKHVALRFKDYAISLSGQHYGKIIRK